MRNSHVTIGLTDGLAPSGPPAVTTPRATSTVRVPSPLSTGVVPVPTAPYIGARNAGANGDPISRFWSSMPDQLTALTSVVSQIQHSTLSASVTASGTSRPGVHTSTLTWPCNFVYSTELVPTILDPM